MHSAPACTSGNGHIAVNSHCSSTLQRHTALRKCSTEKCSGLRMQCYENAAPKALHIGFSVKPHTRLLLTYSAASKCCSLLCPPALTIAGALLHNCSVLDDAEHLYAGLGKHMMRAWDACMRHAYVVSDHAVVTVAGLCMRARGAWTWRV
eukprot:1158969-Pelagomonas_calceolata.AAC.5